MPWYPEAVRKPINRSTTPLVRPQRITLHTAVTNAASLAGAFKDGPHSHFYVRMDGTVEQYTDTAYRAAADLQGNDNSISIESWDGYREDANRRPIPVSVNGVTCWTHTTDVPAWTPAQVCAITLLLRWLLSVHPSVPRKLATDSKVGSTSHGIAWHRLGVPRRAGDTVSQTGGMLWSTAAGKVCPGDRRIAQIPGIFAAATAATPLVATTPTAPKEEPMPTADQIVDALMARRVPTSWGTATVSECYAAMAEIRDVMIGGKPVRLDEAVGRLTMGVEALVAEVQQGKGAGL